MVAPFRDTQFIAFNLENQKIFEAKLKEAAKQVGNLKPIFSLTNRISGGSIPKDFYKSQQAIFQLKSSGGYPVMGGKNPGRVVGRDRLTGKAVTAQERAEAQKRRRVGFVYPLLVGENENIKNSTTSASHPDSIFRPAKKSLELGTSTPYSVFHNSDKSRRKIPLRKHVFIGPENKAFHARDRANQGGRLTRWLAITREYVKVVVRIAGGKE